MIDDADPTPGRAPDPAPDPPPAPAPAPAPVLPPGLELTVDAPIARLTLTRPEVRNALSIELLEGLVVAARWLSQAPGVRVVVFAGRGRSFCAGADLLAFGSLADDGPDARAAADAGRLAADAIEAIEAVTIARLHGHVVGGGVVLAAACDLRVAADDTVFSIPEVALGIPLAWGGIPRLVREVGPTVTKDLVLSCRPFGAAEAQTMGFVSRVVPPSGLDAEVEALAADVAAKPHFPVRATLAHVDAITAATVGTAGAWSDADALLTALRDPECRRSVADHAARLLG